MLLTSETLRVLKVHRDRQRIERQSLGEDAWSAGDAIVTTTAGTIPNPTTVKTRLRQLLAVAAVPDVTTYELRHMAATRMLRAGVSPALVAQKLGHRDISTTTGTYGHLIAEDQGAANLAIEQAIQRARGVS